MTIKTGLVRFNDDLPGVYIRGDEAFLYATALKFILDQFELNEEKHVNQVFWYGSELYNLLSRSDLSHREFNAADVQLIVFGEDSKY
jgi:hypothetical protein